MTEHVPTGRFEWERIVRRMMIPAQQKLLAFVLASYADPDGSRVRPGNDVLAAVTGQSEKNVRRHLSSLRSLSLLEQKTRGGGRGGKGTASEYQLTIPTDLLERVDMLGPGDRPKSADTQMSGQSDVEPVDNSESRDTQKSGQSGIAAANDRTHSAQKTQMTGHVSPNDRTSGCPTTTHDHPQQRPELVVTRVGETRPRASQPNYSSGANLELDQTPTNSRLRVAHGTRHRRERGVSRVPCTAARALPQSHRRRRAGADTRSLAAYPGSGVGGDMTRFEAICGFCDERRVFATAEQRMQWLDYHWADWDHDPTNAFRRDIPEPHTADETAGSAQHPESATRSSTRPNERPRRRDGADRARDAVWESIRKQREEKQ